MPPASTPGTTSTTWARTRRSCGRNTWTGWRKPARAVTDTDFGFERVAEEEKARRVAQVFDRVADRYDLMNDLMSFGLHRLGKAFTVFLARIPPGDGVLDVPSRSGDLAAA